MSDLEHKPVESLQGEYIEIRYIPVGTALVWDKNPKLHTIGDIIESITKNGFRDPPSYDATLDALVEGNGRATALNMMSKGGYSVPRGIMYDDNGDWYMPVNFGINAITRNQAIAYAIDHNNLTMAGGDFTSYDMSRMWSGEEYKELLSGLADANEPPVSLDLQDISALLSGEHDFDVWDDQTDIADDYIGTDDDDDGAVVFTLVVENTTLEGDVFDAVQELLELNPGWQARLSRNE